MKTSYTEKETVEACQGSDEFEEVDEIHLEHKRWGVLTQFILKRVEDGTHWAADIYVMSGDSGEHEVCNCLYQVEPEEVTHVEWKACK